MRRRSCYMLIAGVATLGAGCGTVLAFYKQLGHSLSVILGYAVLLVSSLLVGLFLTEVTDDGKRTVFLVVLVLLLVFVLGTITALLFSMGGNASRNADASEAIESGADTGSDAALIESDSGGGEISGAPPDEEVNMDAVLPAISLIPTEEPASIPIEETEDSRTEADNPVLETDGSISSINTSVSDSIPNIESVPVSDTAVHVDSVENINELQEAEVRSSDSSKINVFESDDEVVNTDYVSSNNVSLATDDIYIIEDSDSLADDSIDDVSSDYERLSVGPKTFTDENGPKDDGFFTGLSADEADFWSTFFIQGEDDLNFTDGVYYLDLHINQQLVGTIETIVESGKASISKSDLDVYISDNINEDLFDAIMAYEGGYIPLEYIDELGVIADFDSGQYCISLVFSAEDMPVQILSIRGVASGGIFRPIADGITLDPAFFVLRSRWRFNTSLNTEYLPDWGKALRFTFASSHRGRISDIYFDFSLSMRFGVDYFRFSMGSYEFYKDFEDEMIRLSWGNVSTDLLSPAGTAFGIAFDKDYSYGSPSVRRKSHVERTLLIDKESRVIVYNEGKEIFNRTLQAGNYRLQDFVLYSGANEILIRIEPTDGSAPTEQIITLSYANSLLAPGEVYYGASFTTGRQTASSNSSWKAGEVYIPLGTDQYLKYDIKNLTLSGYVKAGLTESLTINSSLAMQNYPTASKDLNLRFRFNTELTHANILGTTRYNLNFREYMNEAGTFGWPGVYVRVGHQISTGWNPISSVSVSLTYANPEENNRDNAHRFSLSGSLSGRVGFMSWSTSLSGSIYTDKPEEFTYSASASMSFSLARNFWLSGSISLSSTGYDIPSVRGSVYATYRFSGGSVTASTGFNDARISVNAGNNTHSATASIDANRFDKLEGYDVSAGYSYNGKYFDFDIDAESNLLFRNVGLEMELATETVFADGLFALGADIPANFLLISQKGALKGNELSAGSVGSSATKVLNPTFGSYLYTGLSTTRGTSFSLYSSNPDSFNGAKIFNINVPYSPEAGYIIRLESDASYAVTGLVTLPDNTLWTNGASPLYKYSESDGKAVLETTENYAFTDADGRFLISDLQPGLYAFDFNYGDEWFLLVFPVNAVEDMPYGVQSLEVSGTLGDIELPEVYSGSLLYSLADVLTNDQFWNMVYPEMEDIV